MAETETMELDVEETKKEVVELIKKDEKAAIDPKLEAQAKRNVEGLFKIDMDNIKERKEYLKPLDDFGLQTMDGVAQRNKLLSTRFVDIKKGGGAQAEIGDQLSELDLTLKDLDPNMVDFLKTGFLGKLFNPVRKYFQRYEKAETAIDNIIKSLNEGSNKLHNDNVSLLSEEEYLREATKKLLKFIQLGKAMDVAIEEKISEAELGEADPDKINFVREEILFPLRQRIMDMQQAIVTNQEGIVTLNIIRKNNRELINGVRRAQTVTVTALRTGVMAATALYNQKIVLDKINALNKTTENIITATSKLLRTQGADIQRQATETMISPEVLKQAFSEALQALQDIQKYKLEALPKMQQQINTFELMADEGQKIVNRLESSDEIEI
ncbi:MAG: toxic anion resistance protein [Methanobrevibacter sp.]|jgi:uncharacterized protein YaaN involved in tellurite resistance|nr:toxic anion resistance protein [Candidatus Methanovirga aequatorialis]